MRTTPLALAAAAMLACALPASAQQAEKQTQKEKQPARESEPRPARTPSAELDQARVDLKHAELDVATSEENAARLERQVAEAQQDPEASKTGGGRAQQATLELYQERQRLQQYRATLAHRRLDVDELERRAEMSARAGSLSIEFSGGSVGDFIGALSRASGAPVNIIVTDPQISGAPMGPVSLRGVTVETAVRVIPSAASARRGQAQWDVSRIDDQHGAPVFRIRQVDTDRPNGMPIVTEIVSLAGVSAGGTDAKAALSAVDAALGVIDTQGEPPEIKYHPESGLLIVRGTPPQVSTIREVVSQMSGDSERKRAHEVKRASAKIASEMQARKLQIQHDRAAAELGAAEAEYKDFVKMHEAGTMPDSQVRDAELKLAQARAGAQLIEAEMIAAQRQAELGASGEDARPAERPGAARGGGGGEGDRDAMIQQLRAMVEDLKSQNDALQQQVRALQADKLKKDKPATR